MGNEKRKTFVARDDLLSKLNEIAKLNGKSLYETVNEIFELTIHANSKGIMLKDAIAEQGILNKAKDKGMILALESLWFDMADICNGASKSEALKAWNAAGTWFARRYAAEGILDPFQGFKEDLLLLTWGVPELALHKKGNEVQIRVISPKFSEIYSQLLSSFMEGALDELGYQISDKEILRGSLRINAFSKKMH